jgi:hypothetical protein
VAPAFLCPGFSPGTSKEALLSMLDETFESLRAHFAGSQTKAHGHFARYSIYNDRIYVGRIEETDGDFEHVFESFGPDGASLGFFGTRQLALQALRSARVTGDRW